MALAPDYGETPVSDDEFDALTDEAKHVLGEPISKVAVYDLEQALQEAVAEELLLSAYNGALTLDAVLDDLFVRELHRRLYGDVWSWAGVYRKREINIGVPPELIAVEVRSALGTIQHRWKHTADWTAHQLGIAVHAEIVRVHPFADGNGRTTRLLADLVFAVAQEGVEPDVYDWEVDKQQYIDLLREYDHSRDPAALAAFIKTRPLAD